MGMMYETSPRPRKFVILTKSQPVGVGVRGIPVGFGILTGAFVVLWLLSVFRGHNKELLIVSSALMTAGGSLISPFNI